MSQIVAALMVLTGRAKKLICHLNIPFNFLDGISILAISFFIVFFRWTSITYPLALNPDEAQAAANTLRIISSGYSWNGFDGTTAGPFNSILLLWPKLLGFSISFFTVRITSATLLVLTVILLYYSIKSISNRVYAFFLVIPLTAFYGLTKSTDFLHYSSEQLSVLLIVLANYLLIIVEKKASITKNLIYLMLGIFLGSIPFCKLQAIPIAFLIGIYSLALIIFSFQAKVDKCKNIICLFFGCSFPAVVMFTPLVLSKSFHDFFNSYILWAGTYVRNQLTIADLKKMIDGEWLFKAILELYLILITFLITSILLIVICKHKKYLKKQILFSTYGVALVIASIFSIITPGNAFPHYLHFLLPVLIIFLASLTYFINNSRIVCFVFVIIYFFTALYGYEKYDKNFIDKSLYTNALSEDYDLDLHNPFSEGSKLFSWMPFEVNYLLVWGWMPQWYVLSGASPASRESHTYAQIVKTSLSIYFQKRFLDDIKKSNPEVIIDAVNGASFGFNDPDLYSASSWKIFSDFLTDNYVLINPSTLSSKCPKTFIRKDFEQSFTSRFITPKTVWATKTYEMDPNLSFSPLHLFDSSLTEDSCIDYWLLPDKSYGSIHIKLENTELIDGLMILNTRNSSFMDRSTTLIKVRVVNDRTETAKEINIKPYPFWSTVAFSTPINASEIILDIEGFKGRGGGLNEIKILRYDKNRNIDNLIQLPK